MPHSFTPAFTRRLREFCEALRRSAQEVVKGEPEERLRQPFASFVTGVGDDLLGPLVVAAIGETRLQDIGRPDYAITVNRLLCGYCELKAAGTGVFSFKGRDSQQFVRFGALPNILYTDGEQWGLYRHGVLIHKVVLAGPPDMFGDGAVTDRNATELFTLFVQFLEWTPPVPSRPAELAKLLAPLCRLLRDEVSEAMKDKNSGLRLLAADWRNLLFPKASDSQVADACAQVITYGLLLARTDSARTTDLSDAIDTLSRNGHGVLAKALRLITEARHDLGPSLPLLQRIIERVPERFDKLPWSKRDGGGDGSTPIVTDAWIYFYEDFLKEYDPTLREQYGIYYTPVPVVEAQVRMVESVLRGRLGLAGAFAEPEVVTLDPAVGTGTYLLAILKSSLRTGTTSFGAGAAAGIASQLGRTLHGFEKLAGPYAVAELRVAGAILSIPKAQLPKEGVGIVLTDTLADPETVVQESLMGRELVQEHAKARRIKSAETRVMVVIGNPPYGRHESFTKGKGNESDTGGWVRHGARSRTDSRSLMEDFVRPVKEAGKGGQVKNLYNLYSYFWRWSCWKALEQHPDDPGIVCFISASSFLAGDAFLGLRKHLRTWCDDIWVIDLGGDSRGGSAESNVFDIETPVCITLAFRNRDRRNSGPATVRIRRIDGTRGQKFDALRLVATAQDPLIDSEDPTPPNAFGIASSTVASSPAEWRTVPLGLEDDIWSLDVESDVAFPLENVFKWMHSGLQMKRRWPIASFEGTLVRRWERFISLPKEARSKALVETETRNLSASFTDSAGNKLPTLGSLEPGAATPSVRALAYRPWDIRNYLCDPRLGDRLRTDLSDVISDRNLLLVTLTNTRITAGPCVLATTQMPDLHFFRGTYGAKDVMPLYRDPYGERCNLVDGLLPTLGDRIGRTVSPVEFCEVVLAILGTGAFARVFPELIPSQGGPRLPIPLDPALWLELADLGRQVKAAHLMEVQNGEARLLAAPPEDSDEWRFRDGKLIIGRDGEFGPVSESVANYQVSGYAVIKGWIEARLASPRKTGDSELDRIGEESWSLAASKGLLRVLWSLEKLISIEACAEPLLVRMKDVEWLDPSTIAKPTDSDRKAPKQPKGASLMTTDF